MNKIKILIAVCVFSVFNNVICSDVPTRTARQVRTAQPRTAKKVVRTLPRKPVVPAATRKPIVSTRTTRAVQKPEVTVIGVEPIVWENLSNEQQTQFKTLKQSFENTVNAQFSVEKSSSYQLWQKSVIEKAKKIIDIDILLKDYCVETITARLNKIAQESQKKEIDINLEEKINTITRILDQYIVQKEEKAIQAQEKAAQIARENLLSTGTTKEQFNNLLKKENVWVDPISGKLARQWFYAVVERAQKLIFAHELDAPTAEEYIRAILARKFTGDIVNQYVNGIMGEINKRLKLEATRMSPLYVNDQYQNLLLSVDRYWNTTTNQPREEWIKAMIVAAKNMIKVLKISVNDIERHIGSQLFFVAIDHKKQELSPAQEAAIMAIIDRIKQSVQS